VSGPRIRQDRRHDHDNERRLDFYYEAARQHDLPRAVRRRDERAAVRVKPRLSLAKLAAHKYRVRVFAAESFAGKAVVFQRWNATRRAWVRVKTVTLTDTGLGVAPTVISGRDFRSRIAAGKRVRVFLSQLVAGTCYVANTSGVIRS